MHEPRSSEPSHPSMHALLCFCAATMMEPLHFGFAFGGLWLFCCGRRSASSYGSNQMLRIRSVVARFNFTPKNKNQNTPFLFYILTTFVFTFSIGLLVHVAYFSLMTMIMNYDDFVLSCSTPSLPRPVYSLCRTRRRQKPTRGGEDCASLIRMDRRSPLRAKNILSALRAQPTTIACTSVRGRVNVCVSQATRRAASTLKPPLAFLIV
jgi:hypothetical protein